MQPWLSPEVLDAVGDRRPVVALETAVLTHGLPAPQKLEVMASMTAAVRSQGAIPAVAAILEGKPVLGATMEECQALADHPAPMKAGTRDLGWAMATGAWAGTTVSGTLALCRLGGVRVFATGGMGGVHRAWQSHLDVSSDLKELAISGCCLISAGAKSVLDLAATVEALESLAIPVLVYGSDFFPQFHSRGTDRLAAPRRFDQLETAARFCLHHWQDLQRKEGVLIANPIPESEAMDASRLERVVEQAQEEAQRQGITGPAVTPFLLERLSALSEGESLQANLALLKHNAEVAANFAVELAALD
ncbi:MAG: pseudouridine-5'-phosphate glycosidase [Planctomycetota bacterium]|nr:MAG: pseudouridine-5'-phosphate glycosidase [Planctomycetota bacterium]